MIIQCYFIHTVFYAMLLYGYFTFRLRTRETHLIDLIAHSWYTGTHQHS